MPYAPPFFLMMMKRITVPSLALYSKRCKWPSSTWLNGIVATPSLSEYASGGERVGCWLIAATPKVSVAVTPIIATTLHAAAAIARRRNALCLRTVAALTSAASRFAETGIRKPATTEATAGIRNINAWAIIKPDLLLISQASITNAMCGNRSVRACMICSRPVRCCISWITSTTSTADRNAGRTAVERIVRKIAAMTADAMIPSTKPSARSSISDVKIGSPGSTQMVSCRITSGSA